MKSKVLVTGGAGFVGSNLVRRLLDEGHKVTVLDDLSTGSINNLHGNAVFIEGDIRDSTLLALAAKDCEIIFHLAAQVELQKSIVDPANCFSVNVTGTANVLMESIKIPRCRLVFASSCAVYPLTPNKPLTENLATQGETPYAMSKIMGERMMEFYQLEKGLNYCALRCFNIYGPGQSSDSPYAAVVPKFITAAKKKNILKLFGGGKQTRDFIHVDDMVEAYILMSKSKQTGVFNVGTGRETSIRELAQTVVEIYGDSIIKDFPAKPSDAIASCADITKIQSVSDFSPSITISNGLKKFFFNS